MIMQSKLIGDIYQNPNFKDLTPIVAPSNYTFDNVTSEFGIDLVSKINASNLSNIQFAYLLKDGGGTSFQNDMNGDYWYSDNTTPMTKITNTYSRPGGSTKAYILVTNQSSTPSVIPSAPIQLDTSMRLLIVGKNMTSIISAATGCKYIYSSLLNSLSNIVLQGQTSLVGKLYLPDSLTSYGSWSFSAVSVNGIKFPNNASYTEIADTMFRQCTALTEVVIPNSVTIVRDWSFSYISTLTKVTFGTGVATIGFASFFTSNALTEVTCLASTPPNTSAGTYIKQSGVTLKVPTAYLSVYSAHAFWGGFSTIVGI